MSSPPKVTFGIIALNAQPFLEYNLKALYPHAHQIIVVEGAVHAAASLATADGHSSDDTLEMLRRFKKESDPEDKVQIVTAADEGYEDGFWLEKLPMSQAYARRATGDWLWQVDADEFYLGQDMQAVLDILRREPDITAMSFRYHEFFGGFDYVTVGKWHLVEHRYFHRLFKWGPGYKYVDHRPPTVVDGEGRNLRKIRWRVARRQSGEEIFLRHYSYALPKQAEQKVGYYSNVDWTEAFRQNQHWYEESYLGLKRPLFLGERGWPILQWLERFEGEEPSVITQLRNFLNQENQRPLLRENADIERLLSSPLYVGATRLLRVLMPYYWRLRRAIRPGRRTESVE